LLVNNSSADAWADSAYQSAKSKLELHVSSYRNKVSKKGRRNKPFSVMQKEINSKITKTRASIEHVFYRWKMNKAECLFDPLTTHARA
jgi:hypothetical protein